MPYHRISLQLLAAIIAGAIVSGLITPRVEAHSLDLLLPLIGLLVTGLAFTAILQRLSGGSLQYCELGFVFGGIVLLYGAFPLASLLARGQTFTVLDDVRLYAAQPGSAEIAAVGWYYAIFLACFAIAYLVTRGNSTQRRVELPVPGLDVIAATVLLLLLIQIFFLAIEFLFGGAAAQGYGGRYRAYLHLPRLVHQIANHLDGVILTLNLLLITALVTRWNQARAWIIGWLVLEAVLAWAFPGSRTRLFLLLVGFVISYHYLVQPLKLRSIVTVGGLGLVFFLALGVWRASGLAGGAETSGRLFAGGTEFESLFINAVDLARLKESKLTDEIIPTLYFGDLMRLVPQQLLPWVKIDLADWYVNKFYPDYAKLGGGLAFGAIAESVVGIGIADIIWRGLAVGVGFGLLQRHFARGQVSYWRFALYLWIVLLSYHTLRNSTFTLLPLFFYQFIPAAIGVLALSRLLRAIIATRLWR